MGSNPANIICGAGSDELLGLLCRCYLGAGDEAIITEHGFLVYRIQIMASGATPVTVKEDDCRVNVDAILAAVTDKTKMVFIANPGNPTGSYVPMADIRRLHAGLPPHVLLVLDAAYAEYVRRRVIMRRASSWSLTTSNVVMARTFSKVYGLAALRVGWLYGPAEILSALNRVRGPFNMSAPAIAAAAAAIRDQAFVEKAVSHNTLWLEKLDHAFTEIGLKVTPSVANFVLIHFPDMDGKRAPDADEFLNVAGLYPARRCGLWLPNALRMTIGSEEANRGVIETLGEFMGRA